MELGAALARIRDQRLFEEERFDTFEEFCRERLNYTRQYGHQLIMSSSVVGSLSTVVDKTPAVETQARELIKLKDAEKQATAWKRVLARTDGDPARATARC